MECVFVGDDVRCHLNPSMQKVLTLKPILTASLKRAGGRMKPTVACYQLAKGGQQLPESYLSFISVITQSNQNIQTLH